MTPVDPVKHRTRVAQCIMFLEKALADEENGTHVIVYTDESYIHDNHSVQNGWFPAGRDRRVARAKRKGRLIIFHAVTKDGLLYDSPSESDGPGDLNIPTNHAEYIYHIEPQKVNQSESKTNASTPSEETVATRKDKKDFLAAHGCLTYDTCGCAA